MSINSQITKASWVTSHKVQDLAYYLAFGLYSLMRLLDRTTFFGQTVTSETPLHRYLEVMVLLLLIAKFISQRASLKSWVLAIGIVLICLLSWRISHEGWLFWLALFIVCSEGIEVKKLAMVALLVTVPAIFFTMICAATGIIVDLVNVRQGIERHMLGFIHPNALGCYLLLICVAFTTVRFGRSPVPSLVLMAITLILNLTIADSRSSAVMTLVLAVLLVLFNSAKHHAAQKGLLLACIAAIMVAIAISYYFMICFDPGIPFQRELNDLLSARLSLAHTYYEMQHFTFFGSDFSQFVPTYWENSGSSTFLVDNAFCHLLLRYGIIPTLLFFAGLFALLFKLLKERCCDVLLLGLTLMVLYGMGESLGIMVECNFFLVAIGSELLFNPLHADRSNQSISGVSQKKIISSEATHEQQA